MKRTIPSLLAIFALCCCLGAGASAMRAQDVEKGRSSKRGWIGVSIQDLTEDLMKRKSVKTEDGAYVSDVVDDSPADSAGVARGDVIVEFSGKMINDAEDLIRAVNKVEPGTKTTISVLRKGEKKVLTITVGKAPKQRGTFGFAMPHPGTAALDIFRGFRTWGMRLGDLSDQLREYFGVPEGEGVLVEEVEAKSAAEKAGIKAGDIIIKIGKHSIDDVSDVRRALERYAKEGKVNVELQRKGTKKTLTLEPEDNDRDQGTWFPRGESQPRNFIWKFNMDIPPIDFDGDRMSRELEDLLGREGQTLRELAPKVKKIEIPFNLRRTI